MKPETQPVPGLKLPRVYSKSVVKRLAAPLLDLVKRWELVHRIARAGDYLRLRDIFVSNATSTRFGQASRIEILRRFEEIDQAVRIASTAVEGLALAEIALSLDCPGDLVECGCFNGGSTAKLSILAEMTDRKLVVFDSFEGLPEVDDDQKNDLHARRGSEWVSPWTAGRYACSLDGVRATVERYGEISPCSFVKGWFSDTVVAQNVPQAVALAFVDVDIAASATDCLFGLWPRLSDRGVFASHDVAYIKVMQALCDSTVWTDRFDEPVPIFWGAGFGLGDSAPHLGFAVKGPDVNAEYINQLTLEK
jgi:hypothetical protein